MLLCRCHYSLGALYELEEETQGAEEEYRLALLALMDADEMDEELTLQADIHYLKGESHIIAHDELSVLYISSMSQTIFVEHAGYFRRIREALDWKLNPFLTKFEMKKKKNTRKIC